jgi:putative tryptophan/tyrosine transport system substrate-binding protein
MKTLMTLAIVAVSAILQPCHAQNAATSAHIGFLAPQGRSLPLFDAFRQGLADSGYVEGRNVEIEARFADGKLDRLPELVAELVRLKVDVLAVTGAVTARAAKKAAPGTPVVFAVVVDPVADGVVDSLERPGGSLTGVSSFDPRQAGKQLALLKEVVPSLRRVAILGDQGVSEALISASEAQAAALGLATQRFRLVASSLNLEQTFAAIKQGHADAVLVLEEPLLGVYANEIAALAASDQLPTLFAPSRIDAGGLLTYGTSQVASVRRMGSYVDKIMKGVKPAELRVEMVTRYELGVNLKTAAQIGIAVPPAVLERADRVIK